MAKRRIMAAVASEKTVQITIDGVDLEVPAGELIVETVKRLGLEIPIFCYHARMKPVGMCRMCLVEVGFKQQDGSVRMMPKPQAGCTLPASEGMVVITDSEMVHRDRKGVLEFLLINHPLDCPICDRGGECPLQNNTLAYGPSTSRFVELKRHLPKAFPLSKHVTLDLERCIQCGRCVRFTEEISGDSDLAFRFRGADMQPSTFQLTDFESKFSGNVIEICPVGALTSAQYRFRARPWDLQTSPAICTGCSNGCSVWFDHRAGKFVRLNGRTNDAVNEEWTCDKGKFGQDFYNSPERLTRPLIRKGDAFETCSWPEAYEAILAAFSKGGDKVAALAGPQVPNEGLYLLNKLFRGTFGSNSIDHRWTANQQKVEERLEARMNFKQVQSPIASLESKSSLLLFGTSLADESPIVFLRVRKAWFKNGSKVVVASDRPTDADSFAHLVLRYKPGTAAALANGLLAHAVATGRASVPAPVAAALTGSTPEATEKATGVPAATIREASDLINRDAAVITTHALFDTTDGQDTLETVAGLAMTTGAEFNCYPLGANDFGAQALGLVPDAFSSEAAAERAKEIWGFEPGAASARNAGEILSAAAEGKIKAIWLVACDPSGKSGTKPLEKVDFLVYQGWAMDEAAKYASVILPMSAPAEQDGTWVNAEGRVQRMLPAIPAPGESKPAWRIFTECMLRAEVGTPLFNAAEVYEEIRRFAPEFPELASLEPDGALLGS